MHESDKMQNTREYKDAYAQTRTALDQIPRGDAVNACQGFLETNQSGIAGRGSEKDESHDARKH